MFQVFKNAMKVEDIRKKIFYMLLILLIYRIGSAIPVPYLDPTAIGNMTSNSGSIFGYIDLMTGGNFSRATLFALSITPYINASIIVQLLTMAIPALERMSKEGEEGRRKINRITRYVTMGIGLVLGFGYYTILRSGNAVQYTTGLSGIFTAVIIVGCFTAGGAIVMWLGDLITERSGFNGISVILFAGIISRLPAGVTTLIQYMQLDKKYLFLVPVVLVIMLITVYFIVVMTNAERRIPVQYAKKVVGRKMYGGQNTNLPIKVTMSGVLPVIFAGAILSVPATIAAFIDPKSQGWVGQVFGSFNQTNVLYGVLYFALIIAFNYFYVYAQYNPIEVANNLRKNSGAVPGIRPGKPTSDFIAKILSKITLIGAIFLGLIAVLPIVFSAVSGMNIAIGGTSVIIVVGVALEMFQQLESQLMMRHYKGFLE